MVCSNCGCENPATHRFCGMCGTPLPQRPIVIPGAQSTISFTRLPLEGPRSTEFASSKAISTRADLQPVAKPTPSAVEERHAPEEPHGTHAKRRHVRHEPRPSAEETEPTKLAPALLPPVEPTPIAKTPERRGSEEPRTMRPMLVEPPPVEKSVPANVVVEMPKPAPPKPAPPVVVDEAAPTTIKRDGQATVTPEPLPGSMFEEAEHSTSLEDFVAKFHYTPPTEDEEVTMTADRPVIDANAKYNAYEPISLADDNNLVLPERPVTEAETRAPAAQNSSFVLEENVEAAAPDRSRFLEIKEPSDAEQPGSGTSVIVGPSFLGLSDPPDVAATPMVAAEIQPPRSHWRAWVSALILLVFGGLAFLQWQSEKSQAHNGPLDLIQTQIQRMKNWKRSRAVSEAGPSATDSSSPASASPTNPGDVAQPQPQQTSPNGVNSKPSASPGVQTPAPEETQPKTSSPPPGQAMQSHADPSASASASKPVQSPDKAVVTAQSVKPQSGGNASSSVPPALPAAAASTPTSATTAKTPPAADPVKQAPGTDELARASEASDPAAASAWLWKSVAKGNPEAPVRLANMYIKGDGVARSCEQAMVLLKSAAAKENASARGRLGALYASGTCVPRDRVKAYEWMSSALQANPSGQWARDYREQLWAQMSQQERAQAQKYR